MRLNDADELKKNEPNYHEGFRVFTENEIDNAPTIENDYEWGYSEGVHDTERPQGMWIKTGQSFVNPNKFRNFCCSNCFWELDEHIRIEPNFCPNCGARMRGKK